MRLHVNMHLHVHMRLHILMHLHVRRGLPPHVTNARDLDAVHGL